MIFNAKSQRLRKDAKKKSREEFPPFLRISAPFALRGHLFSEEASRRKT
jgi:hypothetical protein